MVVNDKVKVVTSLDRQLNEIHTITQPHGNKNILKVTAS